MEWTFFFVISGFLITSIVYTEIENSKFSIAKFYERRIRRIFPALIVVLAFSSILSYVLLFPTHMKEFGASLAATALFVSNMEFWREAGYFDTEAIVKPLLHTWSLAVEEQFYLLFPPLLMVLKKSSKDVICVVLGLILVFSLIISQWTASNYPSFAFYFLPSRIWEPLLGAILFIARPKSPRSWVVANATSLVGLSLIIWSALTFTRDVVFSGLLAFVPCLGSALVIHGGSGQVRPVINAALSTRPLVLVGLISYSLYLWHWPVLVFANYFAVQGLSIGARLVLIALSVCCAFASWRLVERPFRGKSAIWSKQMLFGVAAGLSAAAFVLGIATYAAKGLPLRYSPEIETILAAATDYHHAGACSIHADDLTVCTIGSNDRASPSFAVLGDSVADSMLPALQYGADNKHKSGYYFEHNACAPLLEVNRSDSPGCAKFVSNAVDFILHSKVREVVLIARWAISSEGTRYGNEPGSTVRLSSNLTHCSTACNHEVFEAGLARTVRVLTQGGKRVIIVNSIPEIGFDVPIVLAKEKVLGIAESSGPVFSDFVARQRFVFIVMHDMKENYGAQIIDPYTALCSRVCMLESGGHPIYSDDHHLSSVGAEMLGSLFSQKIL